jgi:predicted transcriptional regulator
MDVDEVFSSKPRMKILKMLLQMSELNVSEIARRLSLNFETTSKHLRILEDENVLQHKQFGRIRLYRFNENSPKAKAVQNFIEAWEQASRFSRNERVSNAR